MRTDKLPFRGAVLTAALMLGASLAQADPIPTDVASLTNKNKLRVLSSDGAVLGITEGISINGDRARLFVQPRGGTIFRRTGGKQIVVTTNTDSLTLNGTDLIMDADRQRVRTKANKSFTDDSSPITILLLSR